MKNVIAPMRTLLLMLSLLWLASMRPAMAQTCTWVAITEAVSPSPATACSQLTFTYTLDNNATLLAGADITVSLPLGMQFNAMTSSANVAGVNSANPAAPVFSVVNWGTGLADVVSFTFTADVQCGSTALVTNVVSVQQTPTGLSCTQSMNSYLVAPPSMSITALPTLNSPALYNLQDIDNRDFDIHNTEVFSQIGYLEFTPSPEPEVTVTSYELRNSSGTLSTTLTPISGVYHIGASELNAVLGHAALLPNEHVVIRENFKVTSCATGNGSYLFGWGCGGDPCATQTLLSNLDVFPGDPLLEADFNLNPLSPYPLMQNTKPCGGSQGMISFVYKNNGTDLPNAPPGSAMALDLRLYLTFTYTFCLPDWNGILLNGVPLSTATNFSTMLGSVAVNGTYQWNMYQLDLRQLLAAEVPPGCQLQDLDADGFADDLPNGGEFVISIPYEYVTDPIMASCTKSVDRYVMWTGAEYDDQCGNLVPTAYPNIGVLEEMRYSSGTGTSTLTAPPDVEEGVPFTLNFCPRFTQLWSTPPYGFDCPSPSYQILLTLPPGYHLPSSPLNVTIPLTSSLTPLIAIATESPGLVTIDLGALPMIHNPHRDDPDYPRCFDLPLELICNSSFANFGLDAFTYEVVYTCDNSCSFEDHLTCATASTYHHCNGDCAQSFDTDTLDFHRVTLGWVNPAPALYDCSSLYSAPLAATTGTGIRLDRAYPSDIVRAIVPGGINVDGSTYTSIHLRLAYDLPGTANIFDFEGGTIDVTDPVTMVTTSYTPNFLPPVINFGRCSLYFELPPSAYSTLSGDERFESQIDLRLLPGTFSPGSHQLVNFRAEYRGDSAGGDRWSCDDWGTVFTALQPYVSMEAAVPYPNACDPIDAEFRLYQRPAKFSEALEDFPNEYRPYAQLNPLVEIEIPEGYTFVPGHTYWVTEYRPYASTASTNFFSTGNTSTAQPVTIASYVNPGSGPSTLYLNGLDGMGACWPLTDLLWGGADVRQSIRLRLQPQCDAAPMTDFFETYSITTEIQQSNPAYQNSITGVHDAPHWSHTTHESTSLQFNASGTVNALSNLVEFTFTFCNTGSVDAPYAWLAFENPSAALQIISAQDLATSSMLTLVNYSGGTLLQVGHLDDGECITIKLTGQVVGCVGVVTPDVVHVQGGYECAAFPSSPADARCGVAYDDLSFTNNPSELLMNVTYPGPANICDQVTYSFLIEAPEPGGISNPFFTLDLPAGVSFVSALWQYPVPSAPVSLGAPVAVSPPSGPAVGWDLSSLLGGPFLPGSGSAPLNLIQVDVVLQLSCDYDPLQFIHFAVEGVSSCSEDLLVQAQHRPTILTTGTADDLSLTATVVPSTIDIGCDDLLHWEFCVENLGTATTSNVNYVEFQVPNYYALVNPILNSYSSSTPNTTFVSYVYSIPALPPGGTYCFGFDFDLVAQICPSSTDLIFSQGYDIDVFMYYESISVCSTTTCSTLAVTQASYIKLAPCCESCLADAGDDQFLNCLGGCVTLDGNGGPNAPSTYTFLWTPSTGLSADNVEDPVACVTSTTTYTLTVTDGNGCESTDDVTVFVGGGPTATVTPDESYICEGQSVNITVTGGNTYSWSPAAGLSCANCPNPVATPTTTTNYQVSVRDLDGCETILYVYIEVYPTPVPDLGPDQVICPGQTIVLDPGMVPSGAFAYLWSDGSSASTLPVNSPGTYGVTVTSPDGCVGSDNLVVTAGSATANAGPDLYLCQPFVSSVALNGLDAGGGCSWAPSPSLSATNICNPNASPTATETFYYTTMDVNGCIGTDDVTVHVVPDPGISIAPIVVCMDPAMIDLSTYVTLANPSTGGVGTFTGSFITAPSTFDVATAGPGYWPFTYTYTVGTCSYTAFGAVQVLPGNSPVHWPKEGTGAYQGEGRGIVADDLGNVYVTGLFRGTMTLTGLTAPLVSTSTTATDIFVAKYNEACGIEWARRFGGDGDDRGLDIALDPSGYVYVTGDHGGMVNFDVATYSCSPPVTQAFVIRMDPGTGAVTHAFSTQVSLPTPQSRCTGKTIAIDPGTSEVYVGFDFIKSYVFDPGQGVIFSGSHRDVMAMKFDNLLTPVLQKQITSTSATRDDLAAGSGVDAAGVYTLGMNIPGRFFFASINYGNVNEKYFPFVARMDANFNELSGFRTGHPGNDVMMDDLTVSPSGDAYYTGFYRGPVLANYPTAPAANNRQIFMAQMIAPSTAGWIHTAGGATDNDEGLGVSQHDGTGEVIFSGKTQVASSFPGFTPSSIAPGSGQEAWVASVDAGSGTATYLHHTLSAPLGTNNAEAVSLRSDGTAFSTGSIGGAGVSVTFGPANLSPASSRWYYAARHNATDYYRTMGEPIAMPGVELPTGWAFPNPTSGQVTVQVSTVLSGTAHVQVRDLTGRTLTHASPEPLPSADGYTLDLGTCPAGVYLITVEDAGWQMTFKVVKQD